MPLQFPGSLRPAVTERWRYEKEVSAMLGVPCWAMCLVVLLFRRWRSPLNEADNLALRAETLAMLGVTWRWRLVRIILFAVLALLLIGRWTWRTFLNRCSLYAVLAPLCLEARVHALRLAAANEVAWSGGAVRTEGKQLSNRASNESR